MVVLGAGTVGLLAMQAAKAFGATVYAVDTRQMSLDLAQELGADQVLEASSGDTVETIASLTGGVGADIVIDTAGAESIPEQAVRMVRRGGLVVVVAIYTSTPRFDFNSLVQYGGVDDRLARLHASRRGGRCQIDLVRRDPNTVNS